MAQLTAMPGAARPRPTPEQHRAADPESSVWVTASAGTGKTHVLSNRLLRLLVEGADPAAILCLTYTKAGAAEMARRVQDDLAKLATMAEEPLSVDLEGLLGRPSTPQERTRAKNGLLAVLDLPGGLRIMTIHSFCQSLLHRFPLEANVSPHFELLEPRSTADLLRRARDVVLIDRSPAVRDAVRCLAVALGEHSLGEGLAALDRKRTEFTRLLAAHDGDVDAVVRAVYGALGIEVGQTLESLRERAVDDLTADESGLFAAASALSGSKNENDRKRGHIVHGWLQASPAGRLRLLDGYISVFLTADRQAKAQRNVATKQVVEAEPASWPALEAEQKRLEDFAVRERAVAVAEKTAALLRVGAAVIQAYERRKQAEGGLDYTDLIDSSRALLERSETADWVRYKLDQRIDHLLIDESQDTSPDQWAIVQALIDDFWSGEGTRDKPPTLFVVGDEKQSIFGFQGANVDTYQRLRQAFRERAEAAMRPWEDVPLAQSFRSAPAILKTVDAVFEAPWMRAGVQSGDGPLEHRAFKGDARGLVEVWPLIEGEPAPDAAPWAPPDKAAVTMSAERRLARTIALQIEGWLRDDTKLVNKDRPIEPGDIMILLPRRGVLQDLLIRELKKNNVPVAGADRIDLTDELAVMDLMALGDALLLPEDDLTVATMLKSPLFGINEQLLFKLAHERGDRPLWRRLGDLRDVHPDIADADDRFRALLARVDYTPPFEFFSRFLAEGAPSGRRRLLGRLGPAAVLPIEAFLAQAIAYERANPPSMQGFLHWLRADSDAIKRDPNEGGDEVRILTVHGSKGLEAPIVFLADTTYAKTMQRERLLWRDDGLPLWNVGKKKQDERSRELYALQETRMQEEHRRLLYVAMTRAEERLIVAGCARKGTKAVAQKQVDMEGMPSTWYDMIRAGLERLPGRAATTVTLPGGVVGAILSFGDVDVSLETARQTTLPLPLEGARQAPLPEWLAAAVRGEVKPPPLQPSVDPLSDDPPVASPLSDDQQRRFGRGLLVHKLLQILPDLPPAARPSAMRRFLEKPGLGLEAAMRDAILVEVSAILDNSAFTGLFGPASRAEVPLVGMIDGRQVSGQVDRLAVLDGEVMVVDYKTNRPPPRELADVSAAYGRQMAVYRGLLRQIYPDLQVRCALLWTEGPRLMMLDDAWLDRFLTS